MSEIVLAPLVGWDEEGYLLGYGRGYFDHTLAALSPRPFAIGVGLEEDAGRSRLVFRYRDLLVRLTCKDDGEVLSTVRFSTGASSSTHN